MKIFISYPPLEGKGTPMLGQNRQFQWFHNPSFIYPMVAASAATLLASRGHDITWDDGIARRWTFDHWRDRLLREKPHIVAMETKTPVVRRHWDIAAFIKRELPDTKVVLMGDHIVIGRLRLLPDYPTAPALYPVSVRRVRVLPPAFFRPSLAAAPLPSANSSDYPGLSGNYTP